MMRRLLAGACCAGMTRRHSSVGEFFILKLRKHRAKMGAKQRRVGSQDAPKGTEAVKSRHKREKDFATVKKLCQVGAHPFPL